MVQRYDIACDWDGVINSYTSGFEGPGIFNDPPVPGAIQWLTACHRAGRVIVINSTRLNEETKDGAVQGAMKEYLLRHGCPQEVVDALHFWTGRGKPRARAYVDDRAVRFEGDFSFPGMLAPESRFKDVWNRHQRIRSKS